MDPRQKVSVPAASASSGGSLVGGGGGGGSSSAPRTSLEGAGDVDDGKQQNQISNNNHQLLQVESRADGNSDSGRPGEQQASHAFWAPAKQQQQQQNPGQALPASEHEQQVLRDCLTSLLADGETNEFASNLILSSSFNQTNQNQTTPLNASHLLDGAQVDFGALAEQFPAVERPGHRLEALSDEWQFPLVLVYSLTAVTSFVLNVVTVLVLSRCRRTELRKYLINLSMSDLLMSLLSIRKSSSSKWSVCLLSSLQPSRLSQEEFSFLFASKLVEKNKQTN